MGAIVHTNITHNGITFVLEIDPDPDARPTDYDAYDAATIDRFANGAWSYVLVTITPVFDDTTQHDAAVVLGAVEYGALTEDGPHISSTEVVAMLASDGLFNEALETFIKLAEGTIASLQAGIVTARAGMQQDVS